MATMTPREQIEWIEKDAREFCMTRCRDRPRLAYLVAPVDITAMTREVSRDVASCGWFELSTAAGYVDVRPDPNKPAGLAPSRCYRCPCGTLFLDNSSRSGRCVVCQMERVVAEVVEIGTPTRRHVPVRADPTLKPDEFRLESGEQALRVIGVDFGSEPSTAVIFHKCGRCEQILDFGDADPTEIAIMKRGHDTICPARNGVVNGVFHIEPDPPDLKERQAAKVAERQREERDRILSQSWESMLDEFYPRDENGRHYVPAPPKGDLSKMTKKRKSTSPYEWVKPLPVPPEVWAARDRIVDHLQRDMGMSLPAAPTRPDGFAQSKIDEIKAMLTAPVKGKR